MQFKNYTFLFISSLVFFLSSCFLNYTPEPYTGVSGIVRDKNTSECIANATVYLLESADFPGAGYYYKDSLITDMYGNFEFEFEKIIGYGYALLANKEHYIESTGLTFIQYGEIKDVLIIPEAFLKVRIHNVNVYDPWDHININGLDFGPFSGNDVDTIVIQKVFGNQINSLYVFLYDDGENDGSIAHHIFCPAFDTTYYELLY